MIDFLKAHPFVSKEEYLWEWTIPQIKLAMIDSTHIEYTKDKSTKNGSSKDKPIKQKDVMKLDSPEAIQEWFRQTGGKI